MNLPAKVYTKSDVEQAKKSGKMVGWMQAAAVIIGGAFVWNLLGWIPTVLVIGAVVYGLYRLLAKPEKSAKVDVDDFNIDDIEV